MKNVAPKVEKVKPRLQNGRLLIPLEEAAELLSISIRTVRRLSQLQKLPPLLKVGRTTRISYPALIHYIRQQGGEA